jgi:hypothetical protein
VAAQRSAIEPVRVVHQTVENGIGNGHIADDLVPMFRRQLAE